MKRNYQFLLLTCLALLIISGCRKPNNKRTTDINTAPVNTGGQPPLFPGGTQPSLRELFKDLRYTPEKQCVTAGILQVVTFSKGTRLTFYPNSFKDAAGNIITSGTVCIEMIEMNKPGDMISNMATTTTTTGDILHSGGQVYIIATKDGQKVYANKYGIAYRQPATSSQPMSLYYGNTNNKDSVVAWTIGNTTTPGGTAAFTITDSSGQYYSFDTAVSFGFTNCDQIHDWTTPRTQVTIIIPDNVVSAERKAAVFIVLPEINGAVGCSNSQDGHTYKLVSSEGDDGHKVPIGMAVSIVVMVKTTDKYYYFEQTGLTTTDGMTVTASMTERTADYIKTRLGAL